MEDIKRALKKASTLLVLLLTVSFYQTMSSSNLNHSGNLGAVTRVGEIDTCPYAWLEDVASHATDSYLLEHTLIHILQEKPCKHPPTVTLDRVLFLVMCSYDKKERVSLLNDTWLAWVPQTNVMLLSDLLIPGYNVTLLPSLPADAYLGAKYPSPTTYEAANLRHLKSIQWLGRVKKSALNNVDWVFMVDDDTFVNLPMLLMLLRKIPSSLALLVGHMWDSPRWDPRLKGLAYPSGGAGMLFTKMGFQRLAANLFEPACDMRTFLNDVTVGYCATASNVTKIHSVKFQPELVKATQNPIIWDEGMLVTVHRVYERERALEYTCLVSKRFDWPHSSCTEASVLCGPACHMERRKTQ